MIYDKEVVKYIYLIHNGQLDMKITNIQWCMPHSIFEKNFYLGTLGFFDYVCTLVNYFDRDD